MPETAALEALLARLPLVRFPAKRAYELPAVAEAIRRAMSPPEEAVHTTVA